MVGWCAMISLIHHDGMSWQKWKCKLRGYMDIGNKTSSLLKSKPLLLFITPTLLWFKDKTLFLFTTRYCYSEKRHCSSSKTKHCRQPPKIGWTSREIDEAEGLAIEVATGHHFLAAGQGGQIGKISGKPASGKPDTNQVVALRGTWEAIGGCNILTWGVGKNWRCFWETCCF